MKEPDEITCLAFIDSEFLDRMPDGDLERVIESEVAARPVGFLASR